MIAVRDVNPLTGLLAGICVSLLAIVMLELHLIRSGGLVPEFELLDDAEGAVAAGVESAQRVRLSPFSSYREVTERPLFIDTRRPPPVPETADASVRASQLRAKWELTGIVVAGDASFAHVRGVRDKQTRKIKIDEILDGWRVTEIAARRVTLSQAAESVTLELPDKTGG